MTSTAVVYDLIARDHASRTFRNVEQATSRSSKAFSALAGAAKRAGIGLAAASVAGAVASVKMAVDFQASMTKIQTQAGGSAKDVRRLSDEVLKLGTYAQQSPKELADSLYHLKSVGLDNVKAMKALRQASDLASVGGASLEDTTNALAGAWRSGIRGATNFHGAVGTLNAIIGAGNMRMEDLNAAMGTGFLPAAKTFGLSLKQVGAALALMTDEGIPADAAATRLRMSFSLLGAPSKAAETQLKKIGLTGLQLARSMRSGGLIGAIGLLRKRLQGSGMDASQTAQLLSRAFGGGRSSSAILTMINNFKTLKQKQDQVNHSAGKFGQAVKTQRQTAQAQFALLRSSIDVTAVKLGTALLPPVVGFVRFLNNTLMPDAGKVKRHIAAMIPSAKLKKGFDDAKAAVKRFFGSLDDYRTTGTNTVVDLINHWIDGIDKMNARAFGKKLGNLLVRGLSTLGSFVAKITGKFSDLMAQVDWVGIGIAVGKQAPSMLVGLAAGILNFDLFGLLKGVAKHWQDVLFAIIAVAFTPAKVVGKVAEVLARIPLAGRLLSWGLLAFKRFSDRIVGWVFSALKGMGRGFLEGFRTVFPGIGSKFAEQLRLFPTRIGVMAIDVAQKGRAMIRGLGDAVAKAAVWPIKQMGRLAGLLVKVFAKSGGWLIRGGRDLISGLLRGITALVTRPVQTVTRLGTAIVRVFRSAGSWLVTAGKNIVSGMTRGLAAFAQHPIATLRKLGDLEVAVFNKAGSWLLQAGKDLIAGMLGGIKAAMRGIGGWLKAHIWGPITGGVKALFGIHSPSTVFHDFGVQMIRGLIGGLIKANPVTAVKKIFGGVSGAAGKALGWLGSHGMVALDKVAGLGGKAMKALGGVFGIGGGASGGSGVSRWNNVILTALKMLGQPASLLGAVQHRMMQESGGNPRAINNWDINAQHGDPSRGLMQTIGSTFAAYAGPLRGRGIYDPLANVFAGLNYALHRYGSIFSAMMRPGGYARGTLSAVPGWHWVGEQGPELMKMRGGEQVKTHRQSTSLAGIDYDRLADAIARAIPDRFLITGDFNGYTPREIFQELDRRERAANALVA